MGNDSEWTPVVGEEATVLICPPPGGDAEYAPPVGTVVKVKDIDRDFYWIEGWQYVYLASQLGPVSD